MKCVANPIAAVIYPALMIMVFPLKVFDVRAADIIFYEIGLIVAAGITFYAINHKAVKSELGISFIDGIASGDRVRYFLVMLSMAMGIWYSCACMNDDYDTFRHLSERKMAISFIVMMLLTFTAKEAFNVLNIVWLVVSGIGGVYYYNRNLFPESEADFTEKNTAIKYAVIIFMLSGLLAINLIKLLAGYINEKLNKNIREFPRLKPALKHLSVKNLKFKCEPLLSRECSEHSLKLTKQFSLSDNNSFIKRFC